MNKPSPISVLTLMILGILVLGNLFVQKPLLAVNSSYMNYGDEGHIVRNAQNMYRANTLDPQWYQYGAAIMHSINISIYIRSLLDGDLQGVREQTKVYPRGNFSELVPKSAIESEYSIVDPPQFLNTGRSVVLGTFLLAMILVYLISRRWLSPLESLLPVLISSTIPILFKYQSFVHGDIPLMTCLLGTLLCCFKWAEKKQFSYLVLGSIIAGIAAGIKYSGLLLLGFPVFFVCFYSKSFRKILPRLVFLPLFLIAGYYVSNPGSLGNEKEVVETFLWDKNYYAKKKPLNSYYQQFLDKEHVGWPLLSLAFIGIGFALFSGKRLSDSGFGAMAMISSRERRIASSILLIWMSCYFFTFQRYGYQPLRNMFCILPILCLFASLGLVGLFHFVPSRLAGSVLCVSIGAFLLIRQIDICRNIYERKTSVVDSRIVLTDWLSDNIPSGAEVRFLSTIAFSRQTLSKASEAGLRLEKIPSVEKLLDSPEDSYIVLPTLKDSGRDSLSISKELENQGRKIVKETGTFQISIKPNYFKSNQMKLMAFSPLSPNKR